MCSHVRIHFLIVIASRNPVRKSYILEVSHIYLCYWRRSLPFIVATKSEFIHLRLHNTRPTGTFIKRFSVKLLFTSTAILEIGHELGQVKYITYSTIIYYDVFESTD